MESLTRRQKEIYEFLRHRLEREGVAPSYEEIRDGLGLKSVSTVHKHLKQLERRGWLDSPWGSRKRALSLRGPGPRALALPLLGEVAAGVPIEALETPEEVEVPEALLSGGECFALRVRGESMIEDGIHDGDIIIVRSQTRAETGQTVVAVVDGEATVKRFHPRGKTVELRPANAALTPLVVAASRVQLRGVVVGLMRKYG